MLQRPEGVSKGHLSGSQRLTAPLWNNAADA